MVQLGHSSTRLPGIKPGLPPPGTKITYFRAKKFTANFPKPETYGLAAQMRRAAVSIPANIAEGFRRRGQADKARFMNMAEGSLEECRYYLILAQDLGYGDAAKLARTAEEISRLLSAYAAAILSPDS